MIDKQPMRVVLLSSTVFGYRCLMEGILSIPGIQVKGILTTPARIETSFSEKPIEIRTHADFNDLAEEAGCEVVTIRGKKTSAAYLEHIDRWKPHLLLVIGWYYIIPRKVWESAPLGCVGIHASLLPKYRGGAPLVWAIINGETPTGVTLFYLDDGVDTGDIIVQKKFEIDREDTIKSVYDKATKESFEILREYIPLICQGKEPRIPQDHKAATQFPMRTPEDGLIDWSKGAEEIRNFIRAQTKPYPGAFTFINGKKLIIWDADVLEVTNE